MRYVIIGASAAGINGAENLRRLDKESEIVLISEDDKVYSRCILHHYISSKRNVEELNFVDPDFFEKNKINWIKGKKVVSLSDEKKEITLSNGEIVKFDKVLIASGSSPFIPPIENLRGKKNVVGLKSLSDCEKIMELAKTSKNILVIGAGLIGIDAVVGLLHFKNNDLKINLVEMSDRLLPLQLDKRASIAYEKKLQENKVELILNSKVLKANLSEEDSDKIKSILLEGDIEIQTDLIVVATGIRPNVDFLKDSNIEVDKLGLVLNEKGETNIKDIYGAGDVSGRGPIWSKAVKESIIATSNMAGVQRVMDDFFVCKSTMNFFNIPTLSLGNMNECLNNAELKVDILEDDNGNYKKIMHKNGYIYGAIIQGDLSYSGILTQLIKADIDISKVKKPIFSIDYSDFFRIKKDLEFEF
ncbi:NAD(P)/FAD-dependent oxidoreductase [Cetobacterium sp. 8H]|uniref:NAD(P)/FAD-dependent oxidoreductase n=1 Tax=Cetobacterium sp. 8H TaxID=2759681 RepID=UPI00163C4BD8|nr:FAD-dependent oxidoreductase [Cetobacterium sp. 8H]MBC2850399.1 NAD(P)/FAD-dependent oxidoreductase [Cetobacterium sp. 8H]